MKSALLVVVVTLLVCMNAIGQTSTAPSVGDGSSGSPYQIATLNNLYWISQNSTEWSKYFVQTVDIDASATSGWSGGAGFPPIGNTGTSFTGSYVGNGKIISGLYINNSADVDIGLFGRVNSATATITSLGLTGVNISASNGALVRVGGMVGYLYGTLTNCYSTGSISRTGAALAGGLIGYSDAGTLSKCYSKVNVSVNSATYVGGLAGSNNGSFSDCYATGNVVGGSSSDVGGLIGFNGGIITNCYSSGSVTGSVTLGGLIGGNNSGTYNNSFWDNQTSGQASSGGGTGKTTADMKTQTTFTGAGWNFTTTWEMIGTNYPRLRDIPDGALPVEFTSMTATALPHMVALRWQTATEVNNYGFEIERKLSAESSQQGAVTWKKAGFVSGSGTSSSPHEYSYLDRNLAPGRYAYRIKQIDNGGTFRFTQAAEAEIGLAPIEFTLGQNYPNPFNPTTTIEFSLPEAGQAVLKVFNGLGQEVATLVNERMLEGVYHQATFNANHLATGMYFAKLEFNGKSLFKKLLVVK
jgi:hypothetical protein